MESITYAVSSHVFTGSLAAPALHREVAFLDEKLAGGVGSIHSLRPVDSWREVRLLLRRSFVMDNLYRTVNGGASSRSLKATVLLSYALVSPYDKERYQTLSC